MATWAIGDIQGCYQPLQRLLARIRFDPARDRIWLVGDLVNRGPQSLEVLRWAHKLGDRLSLVLGNHDLHLLARATGLSGPKRRDTLDEVLAAPDRDVLIGWLRRQPLLHREGEWLMIHAGLLPHWTPDAAQAAARACQQRLAGPGWLKLLAAVVAPAKEGGSSGKNTSAEADLAACVDTVRALTRLRTLRVDGTACDDYSGEPKDAPPGCLPWFDVPGRQSRGVTCVFGHWSALGLWLQPGLMGLDTGCVWGRSLTAVRLEDRAICQEPA